MDLNKKGRYVYCSNCGCRLKMNGVCKICGDGKSQPKKSKAADIVDKIKKTKAKEKAEPETK